MKAWINSECKPEQYRLKLFHLLQWKIVCKIASVVSDSATLWTIACQTPLSLGFFRQEYWCGLPCPAPADLPNPGIKPTSLKSSVLAGMFFTTSTTWEALYYKLESPKNSGCWLSILSLPESTLCPSVSYSKFGEASLEFSFSWLLAFWLLFGFRQWKFLEGFSELIGWHNFLHPVAWLCLSNEDQHFFQPVYSIQLLLH